MALIPLGKPRLMVAQRMSNPISEELYNNNESSLLLNKNDNSGDIPVEHTVDQHRMATFDELKDESVPNTDLNIETDGVEVEDMETEGKSTITQFIFTELEKWGYPGRRLQEFKKKFVTQDISPDGTENVKIEIPDKKYPDPNTGHAETIETSELSSFVRQISSKFGLNFNGAHRSDGKWTIDFTSSEIEHSKKEDKTIMKDNLDEVYGQPTSNKKNNKKLTKNQFMDKLIKEEKDNIIHKLKKIIGDNNAT